MLCGTLQLRVNCKSFGCIETLQIAAFIAAYGGHCCVHTQTAHIHCFVAVGIMGIEVGIGPAMPGNMHSIKHTISPFSAHHVERAPVGSQR